jgi:hypothetical protein
MRRRSNSSVVGGFAAVAGVVNVVCSVDMVASVTGVSIGGVCRNIKMNIADVRGGCILHRKVLVRWIMFRLNR